MASVPLPTTTASARDNAFQDLSGASNGDAAHDPNPHNALINASAAGPGTAALAARYEAHRTNRAAQQRALLLAPGFGVTVDGILRQLLDADKTGYEDPRNCCVVWARPPAAARALVSEVQARLREVIPNAHFQPEANLHMTALELVHSLTPAALAELLETVPRAVIEAATDLPRRKAAEGHVARLARPRVVYDGSALAVSWLPVGDGAGAYTYHHLRRDLFSLFHDAGIPVASRYVVPSAHMTIARFVDTADTAGGMLPLIERVEQINTWLDESGQGEWTVGEEKGLDFRIGRLWYGDGETVLLGRPIEPN